MPGLDQILPSLESLGLWSYWLIGLAAFLEGFFVSGIVVPGSLIVDAGGILAHRGILDFFDLIWFVAIGSALGGEVSFRFGRRLMTRYPARFDPQSSAAFRRATDLFARHGPAALIFGSFAGPAAGFVPLAAASSGMAYRRFAPWNIVGSVVYAVVHLSLGYVLGETFSRIGTMATRAVLVVVALCAVIAVLWFLVSRLRRSLPVARSAIWSIGSAIAASPRFRALAVQYPETTRLIASRFDRGRFAGLTLTVLSAVFLYILGVYVASVLDLLLLEPIVEVDQRLAALIHTFWDPRILRVAAHLTALGDWRTVTALAFGAAALLFAHGRLPLAAGLGVAVVGNVISVAVLKAIFDRARPELAYFTEASGSFPSGHAAISVAFYGYLAFALWRARVIGPATAALSAVTVAVLIGFSRVYLIEHYLSDVLNGYLVGAMWLVIGITVAEWQAERAEEIAAPPDRMRGLSGALCVALALVAVWTVATYDKARNVVQAAAAPPSMVADIPALWTDRAINPLTETIAGSPQEPINLVIVTAQPDGLVRAMTAAGWIMAEPPGFATMGRAALAAWTNRPDPNAPVTPYFWQGNPNAVAFQMPTEADTLRKRHHVRFWPSDILTPDGATVFVGSASFDDGLDGGVTHHIDPDIDAERDFLVHSLAAAGRIATQSAFQAIAPQQGTNFNGDAWVTDGRVILVTLAN